MQFVPAYGKHYCTTIKPTPAGQAYGAPSLPSMRSLPTFPQDHSILVLPRIMYVELSNERYLVCVFTLHILVMKLTKPCLP